MFGVVTTFSDAGLELYGNRMLETFAKFWPKTVTLYAYYDTVKPKVQADNIVYIPFISSQRNRNNMIPYELSWIGDVYDILWNCLADCTSESISPEYPHPKILPT